MADITAPAIFGQAEAYLAEVELALASLVSHSHIWPISVRRDMRRKLQALRLRADDAFEVMTEIRVSRDTMRDNLVRD